MSSPRVARQRFPTIFPVYVTAGSLPSHNLSSLSTLNCWRLQLLVMTHHWLLYTIIVARVSVIADMFIEPLLNSGQFPSAPFFQLSGVRSQYTLLLQCLSMNFAIFSKCMGEKKETCFSKSIRRFFVYWICTETVRTVRSVWKPWGRAERLGSKLSACRYVIKRIILLTPEPHVRISGNTNLDAGNCYVSCKQPEI